MSRTIHTCKVCDEHSIDCEPPMVECVECRFYFHQYCAIDSESIDESSIDEDKCIDSKHCPKCQGEYIEPEDERFIEGYTEALSIAKVKKLTLNLVEPLCRFEYIKNHLLNLQTISSASDEAIEALAKTKFNLNIGFKDDRLNSQLHRATKETIKELLSYYHYDGELDLSSFAVVEVEVIEELLDINNKLLSFWMCASDDLEYFAEELECDIKVSEGIVIVGLRDEHEKITGLKVGDVIVRCNESPVLSEEDVNSQTKNNETLNLIVNRVGKEVKLTIDLNKIRYPDLMLNGLVEITNEQAKKLSLYNGVISLDGLIEINDEKAGLLSKRSGGLYLDGIEKISDTAIESLSKHQGMLTLNGLTALSDAAVDFLSKHKGELWLDGIVELSDTAAESLSKHKGMINDMDPKEWVDSLKD